MTKVLHGVTCNFADNAVNSNSHILIAGATGAGKSTVIDAIIHSALFMEKTPALMLIDPKRIDLNKYRKMRNVIAYVDDEKGALSLLNDAVDIIENRYKKMQKASITDCHERTIFIVIDELADIVLMDKNIFTPLQRILQKGRQCKVFVICATQICNVQVLPTLLRGNITFTICLHCENANISRLLIGTKGAEMLPLHGRAIIKTPAGLNTVNIPMLPKTGIYKTIEFWNK